MTEKFTLYDTAYYLKTDEDIAAYFDAALEENDAQLAVQALGVIARAKGMTQVAQACTKRFLTKIIPNLKRCLRLFAHLACNGILRCQLLGFNP